MSNFTYYRVNDPYNGRIGRRGAGWSICPRHHRRLFTLVSCSILVLIFSGILWVVGKIPLPFGLNYKMARRNLSRGRAKSATTMLVMMVGIFAMALVFILASSLKETIQISLAKSFGYNAQVSAINDTQAATIKQALDANKVPGLQKYLMDERARLQLISAGGLSTEQLIAEKVKRDKAKGKATISRSRRF